MPPTDSSYRHSHRHRRRHDDDDDNDMKKKSETFFWARCENNKTSKTLRLRLIHSEYILENISQ